MDQDESPTEHPLESMTDDQLSCAIREGGLEVEYLRELAASLGYAESEGWTEEVFAAIECATYRQRRSAAMRTLDASSQ
jgi:hypothetical protein